MSSVCPKCNHELTSCATKTGIAYLTCHSCGATAIGQKDLLKTYQDNILVKQLVRVGLSDSYNSQESCPTCPRQLIRGQVFGTDLVLEEGVDCQSFVFDAREFVDLFK